MRKHAYNAVYASEKYTLCYYITYYITLSFNGPRPYVYFNNYSIYYDTLGNAVVNSITAVSYKVSASWRKGRPNNSSRDLW